MPVDSAKLSKREDIRPCNRILFGLIVCILSIGSIFSSCFEESFEENSSVLVGFSTDTLRFDTVFTTVGSATRSIVISNRSDKNITVNSISLAGRDGPFRLNIDGLPGDSQEMVKILAGDSLYVFVEVTIDPDQPLSASPFIIRDRLVVKVDEEAQEVVLEAFGQNANYFPGKDANGRIIRLTCNNSNLLWNDDKPYVIYGLLFIDSCSLIVAPGTEIYFHGGLSRQDDLIFSQGGMIFLPSGSMVAEGNLENKISLQGDRLESAFDVSPGQWPGIRFVAGSRGNRFSHVSIENSVVGIRADSMAEVSVSNSRIFNTASAGIIGIHADLNVDNTLIHSTGGQGCILAFGGNYQFRHCTIANYTNQAPAVYMDNFTCIDPECGAFMTNPLNARFENCIIAGSNDDEIDVLDATEGTDPASFQIDFINTILRINEEKAEFDFVTACQNCIEHMDEPLFLNEDENIYTLDTMSIARGQGQFIDDLPIDLLGRNRDMTSPDLGCFEFDE